MPFFIVFGLLMILIACVGDSTSMDNTFEKEINSDKNVKQNKITFFICLIFGIAFVIGGIVGQIIMT